MDCQIFLDMRKTMRLTQTQLAEKLGVNQGTIVKYEKNQRPIPEPISKLITRLYLEWQSYCHGGLNIQFMPCGQFHYNMAHWISLSDIERLNDETWEAYYEG